MAATTTNAYLRDAVMTASPEQLQLMLYDGAIRFVMQGRDALSNKRFEESYDKLSRAQKIVLEMQQGLNHEVDPELCERMSALYGFIYHKLVNGCVQKDLVDLDDALTILRYERATWVMLLEKLTTERAEYDDADDPTPDDGEGLSVEG